MNAKQRLEHNKALLLESNNALIRTMQECGISALIIHHIQQQHDRLIAIHNREATRLLALTEESRTC